VQCQKQSKRASTSWIWQNIAKTGNFVQKDSILKYTLQQAQLQFRSQDTVIALIFHKIAANYKNNGYMNEAIMYCDSALAIRETQLPSNHSDIAKTNVVKGSAYIGKNDYIQALNYLEKAFKILSDQKDSLFLSYIYKDLARCYYENGDLQQAIETYKNALNYLKSSQDNYYQCFMDMGIVYYRLYQLQPTTTYYQNAIENYEKALQFFEAQKDSFYIAACQHNLGMARRIVHPQTALKEFQQALIFYEKDSIQLANTLLEIAKTYLVMQQYDKAKRLATQSLDLRKIVYQDFLKHYPIAESYTVLGDIAAARRDFQMASNHYQQAINAFDERTFTPLQQLAPLFGKAKMLLQIGRKKEALVLFNTLDGLIQQITHQFKEDKSKFNLLENHFVLYEKAIQTAFELFQIHPDSTLLQQAFQFSSHSKAVALRQAVNDEKAKFFANIPKDILEKEHFLKQEVAFQQKQCAENPTENHQKQFFQAKENLNLFIQVLEKQFPKYYDLKYQATQVIDLKRLQKSLPSEMLSLEFFAGDSTIYTFAITQNRIKMYAFPCTKFFDSTIYQLRKSLIESNDSLKQSYLNNAHVLYQNLLEIPLRELNLNQKITRLRIIPDGKLGYIPFDALLTAPAPDWKDKYKQKVPFLLRLYATSYAYYSDSALNQKAMHIKSNFCGFGIDYKDSLTNKSLKNKYGYLDNAPKEVDSIQQFIGGKTWKNQVATKNCFLQNAQKSGILHLSMHSTTDDKNPLESQLIFSKKDTIEDNLLIGKELFAQQFTCGLAVLSACHTGDGRLQRGEGIMSLARAFAYSGCPSLVMSLWSIPDRSTSNIMLRFYQNLKQNLPKDMALQQSKLQYLDNSSFESSQKIPNYWAATVLIGDVNALYFETWYQKYRIIVWIIGILGFIIFSLKKI
jgi:CHAT domain-containing protein